MSNNPNKVSEGAVVPILKSSGLSGVQEEDDQQRN